MSKAVRTKTCPVCNEPFESGNNRQIYCSDECRKLESNRRRRERRREGKLPKSCAWCGDVFVPEHYNQIYCCDEHKEMGYQERDRLRQQRRYKMYDWLIKPKALGTVSLGVHPDPDPKRERMKVLRERNRIGLTNRLFGGSIGVGILLHNHPLIPFHSPWMLTVYGAVLLTVLIVHPAVAKNLFLNTSWESF